MTAAPEHRSGVKFYRRQSVLERGMQTATKWKKSCLDGLWFWR